MENQKPQIYSAVGRRKSAIARVAISGGTGKVSLSDPTISKEDIKKYILNTLELVGLEGKYDVKINLSGGGVTSRLEAMRMATSRTIVMLDPEYKTTLRNAGFLTRDAREKERKKPGLKGARKAPQWAKR